MDAAIPMDIVFCGTPEFAVPTLKRLVETSGFDVRLIVTQPDRPRGRGMELSVSPVKKYGVENRISIVQPEAIKNNQEFQRQLAGLRPQAIVVVGYGRIIPRWMWELPPLGNINLHASLLPKYRGAAPIQWAIARGESITGNTTMRIDAGLDTGDILLQEEMAIDPDDTALTLAPRLAKKGADLMIKTLRGLESGSITPLPQDNSRSTLAPILQRDDGRIDFSRSAAEVVNRLRGFQPWPGAFTSFRGRKLEIIAARTASGDELGQAELRYSAGRLLVGCGQRTTLEILEVQPEGKKRISACDFANGARLAHGEKLSEAPAPASAKR